MGGHGIAQATLHQTEAERAADGVEQEELLKHVAHGGQERGEDGGQAVRGAQAHQHSAGKDGQKQVDATETEKEKQHESNDDHHQGN